MSAPWNNAVHARRPRNSSPADHRISGGWSSHAPRDGGVGASRGGWESAGVDSRRLENASSWDVLANNLGGLSVNEGDYSGWGHSPSPVAGGWGSPPGVTENSGDGAGWGSWSSRQAAAVQVDEEPELEADPFGPEVTNNGATNNTGINFDAYEDIPVEVTGDTVPPPVNEFADIDFCDALNSNIRRCKYTKPTPIQRHAIPIAFEGRDLMACAQTGSGKTAAFCFPIISGILKKGLQASGKPSSARGRGPREWWQAACPVALILTPTRELCCQIHDEAKKFAYKTGIKVAVAYGGAPMSNQLRNLQKGVDILVATPGRLIDIIERGRVSLSKINYLTLDEADRMLDMGFEHQVRKIVQQMHMPAPGVRQTMLFSATFPDEIQKLASEFLSNYVFLSVGKVGSSTDLISQRVEFVDDTEKRNHLREILTSQNTESVGKDPLTLVFVQTKKGADSLEKWLCLKGFPATAIHGDKVQMERERALKLFKSGTTRILVATDVAARGLDIPSVAHVINFDMPSNIDDYVHRIGRTGRAGKSGIATAFFSDRNTPIAKALVGIMEESKQEVPTWLHEHAERSSLCGGGGGSGSRQRYYGRSRGYSPPYGDDSHHYPCSYEPSSTADSSQGAAFDYATIVPTGWD